MQQLVCKWPGQDHGPCSTYGCSCALRQKGGLPCLQRGADEKPLWYGDGRRAGHLGEVLAAVARKLRPCTADAQVYNVYMNEELTAKTESTQGDNVATLSLLGRMSSSLN